MITKVRSQSETKWNATFFLWKTVPYLSIMCFISFYMYCFPTFYEFFKSFKIKNARFLFRKNKRVIYDFVCRITFMPLRWFFRGWNTWKSEGWRSGKYVGWWRISHLSTLNHRLVSPLQLEKIGEKIYNFFILWLNIPWA